MTWTATGQILPADRLAIYLAGGSSRVWSRGTNAALTGGFRIVAPSTAGSYDLKYESAGKVISTFRFQVTRRTTVAASQVLIPLSSEDHPDAP
jgi:hypothetical protein